MFIPNLKCIVRKKGKTDVYGRAGTGAQTEEGCAVVKLKYVSQHTTLRGDSGATRAHADEFVSQNRILLEQSTKAGPEDQLEVQGYKIRIKIMHPRYSVIGQLDHYEVEGEAWG